MMDSVNLIGIILEIIILATLVIGYFLLKHYIPSFVAEKAKNLATKQDIGAITHEIESVKTLYTREIELLRAALGSRSHIHQVRYQREFDILQEVTEKVVELRNAVLSLRPIREFLCPR